MSAETDPEDKAKSNGKLSPEFYSRLYPSGWDLSDLPAPRQVSQPVEALPEGDAILDDPPPAPPSPESFRYDLSPRIFQFPYGHFMIEETSDPF